MKIFLIGFMGCGKTTIGKLLAAKLSYSFIDLDEEIEKNQKKTINKLFHSKGEESFREIEQTELIKIVSKENIVVATGGGTPCYANNMILMNNHGKTIYLQSNCDELTKRLSSEKANRPLIKNTNSEELSIFIESKLIERETFYNKACITINTINFTPDQIVDIIYTHYAT